MISTSETDSWEQKNSLENWYMFYTYVTGLGFLFDNIHLNVLILCVQCLNTRKLLYVGMICRQLRQQKFPKTRVGG